MSAMQVKTATVHGRSVSYLEAGEGPVLLLIHGIAGTCENWREVVGPLARHHTVIAPDFPGHGASEAGSGDYSIGALASGLRDLLLALGHERATLVGHSLGGGVAMQLAYQYPEMIERLVLVSSGGLGPEVSPVLRAAALPGADLFISVTAGAGRRVGSVLGRGLSAVGLRPSADVAEVARGYVTLEDADRRAAFLDTLRAVVGTGGPARRGGRPSLPGRGGAGADRLGRARLDHSRAPRRRRPPGDPRQPAGGLRRRRSHAAAGGAGALRRRARTLPRARPNRPEFDRERVAGPDTRRLRHATGVLPPRT